MINSYFSFLLRLSCFKNSVEFLLAFLLLYPSWTLALETPRESLEEQFQQTYKNYQKNPKNWTLRNELIQSLLAQEKRKEILSFHAQWMTEGSLELKKQISNNSLRISKIFFKEAPQAKYLEGLHFLMNKKFANSIERFNEALKEEPDHLEIIVRLGQAYFFLGDDNNTFTVFQAANELVPWDPQVSKWLAHAYAQRGNFKLSFPLFEAALNSPLLDPKKSEYLFMWYAEALWNTNKREQAIHFLESKTLLFPYHIEALSRLSKYQFEVALNDREKLVPVKKKLQLVLSRIPQLKATPENIGANELDYLLYDFEKLKLNTEQLLEVIEQKILNTNRADFNTPGKNIDLAFQAW